MTTANFNKTYLIKQFTYFGFLAYLLGYIAQIKGEIFLLPLVIIFGTLFLIYVYMLIRSFFVKAIELKEQFITISFLITKKKFQVSSLLNVNLDLKQICVLNNKGKKNTYTLKWVNVSDLRKLEEIIQLKN